MAQGHSTSFACIKLDLWESLEGLSFPKVSSSRSGFPEKTKGKKDKHLNSRRWICELKALCSS